MPIPTKRRPATVKAVFEPIERTRVFVAARHERVETFESRLQRSRDLNRERAAQIDPKKPELHSVAYLEKLGKAMMCGRILGVNAAEIAERSWYCDQTKECVPCHHKRAKQRAANLFVETRDLFFHYVLTVPETQSDEKEVSNIEFLNWAKSRMLRKLRESLNKTTLKSVKPYVAVCGIHSKPQTNGDLHQPHAHLAIVAPPGTSITGLHVRVTDTWKSLTNAEFGHAAIVKCIEKGVKVTEAREPAPGCVSVAHVRNVLAYITRTDERNETQGDTLHREKLFEQAKVKTSYSISRMAKRLRKMPSKSHFHPGRLGKDKILVFPLFGDPYFAPVEEYEKQLKKLSKEISQYLRDSLPK